MDVFPTPHATTTFKMNKLSHIIVNFIIIVIFFIIYQTHPFLTSPHLTILSFGYIIGTFLLSPDVDSKSHGTDIFTPYRAITNHRGISHSPILGTLTISFYLIIVILIATTLLFGFDHIKFLVSTAIIYKIEIFILFIGMMFANLVHIISDVF